MAHDSPYVPARTVQADEYHRLYQHEGDQGNDGHLFRDEDTILVGAKRFFVFRADGDKGRFSLREARSTTDSEGNKGWYPIGYEGTIYRPPHPSMTAEDIQGATYSHDDGTHFHFAHCSPQEQIDFAYEVKLYTYQLFQHLINRNILKLSGGPQDVSNRYAAKEELRALTDFANEAADRAHWQVVNADLGHFHRDPHNDHKRDLATASITHVMTQWKATASRDLDVIRARPEVEEVELLLGGIFNIEHRAVRQARLDAIAKQGN